MERDGQAHEIGWDVESGANDEPELHMTKRKMSSRESCSEVSLRGHDCWSSTLKLFSEGSAKIVRRYRLESLVAFSPFDRLRANGIPI